MTRFVMVWGTSSGAGKSWLATALCRSAARRGIVVRPFKAQNMSNNARVVAGLDGFGAEIGAAQYFQALAAGVEPGVDMNPVLLKPERDTASQVVVHGRVDAALGKQGWRERSAILAEAAHASLARLARDSELVIIEGAGSPAEINLAPQDYVNLGTARQARELGPLDALLVTDIDRGGAFAHLYGTWALLPPDLRGALRGFVLNRFRGDAALLAPGPANLQALTGVPLAGVIPMVRGHGLPDEDGLFDHAAPADADGRTLRIAVLCPPHISNLDEFEPLRRQPGVQLAWARTPAQLRDADWIVLPGSSRSAATSPGCAARAWTPRSPATPPPAAPCWASAAGCRCWARRWSTPRATTARPASTAPGWACCRWSPATRRPSACAAARCASARRTTPGRPGPASRPPATRSTAASPSRIPISPRLGSRCATPTAPPSAGSTATCWASTRTGCSSRRRCCAPCGVRPRHRWRTPSSAWPIWSTRTSIPRCSPACSIRAGRMIGSGRSAAW